LTYTKDFSWKKKNDFDLYKGFFMEKKKDPNSPGFEELFFQITRFL